MRRLARADEADAARTDTGVRELVLAAPPTFDGLGLELRRLEVAAGASAPVETGGAGERFLYVIRGSGTARADDAELPLDVESVLWLEPGERCVVVGGPDGLEALAARAPAS